MSEKEIVSKRVIVTTKREVWLRCYEDDEVDEVIHDGFDDLGDYDEIMVEETDDPVTDADIEYAKRQDRLAEWLDD
jgi:hypothetical protein